MDTAGSGQPELLSPHAAMPHWSLDGRTLVFASSADGGRLSLLPLDGDRKPFTYLEGAFAQPAFSPDGKWMAYVSVESVPPEVFVQSIPPGRGKVQISTHGAAQPVWRRDGKELFYLSADNKIVAVPVKMGATFEAGVPKELFQVYVTGGVPSVRR
jgi:eukaryotic-like serine/threonine-protein kinase